MQTVRAEKKYPFFANVFVSTGFWDVRVKDLHVGLQTSLVFFGWSTMEDGVQDSKTYVTIQQFTVI